MTYMAKGVVRTNTPLREKNQSDTIRTPLIERVALTASDAAGGVFAWANPWETGITIQRVIISITTAASAACTIDIGTTATSAATSSDTLLDGLDVNAATGYFDNITDKGTNGKSRQPLAAGKWVTASKASGATAGLVGYAYIEYIRN